jgi:predicted transcriptional regulator of viral defense system
MKKKEQNKWNSFFLGLRERGRYTFTFEDVKKNFDLKDRSISQELYRYSVKKQIVKIRKGFYGILTPESAIGGTLPPDLFVDSLMKSLHKPYYVALLSAAALHGAAHQQPMEYFIVTQTPAPRNIRNKKMRLSFVSKKTWEQYAIEQKKTRAGYLNVSSPELTALDLIIYADRFGLNRVSTILQELAEEMKPSALKKIVKTINELPVIQRLGYILDRILNEEKLAEILFEILLNKSVKNTLLFAKKKKHGNIDSKWKIIVNTEIEMDL